MSGSSEMTGSARRAPLPRSLWRWLCETVAVSFRYRVTGLAAEAGFFALLSMPPLLLGLVGTIGYLGRWFGPDDVSQVRLELIELARRALTERSVTQVIVPTIDEVLQGGRFELVSLGFVLSLWSGSRVLNVYIDTITIMYGLNGHRGIIRTRALSFSLYVVGLIVGAVALPLVLAGPRLVDRILPPQFDALNSLYWPVVFVVTIAFLATLYHVSVPVRHPWRRGLPGALLAVLIWIGGSFVLRWVISASVGSTSIFGPLAAPIVVLLWLYVLAIAVLIGAAANAAAEVVWPGRETAVARAHATSVADEPPLTPVPDSAPPVVPSVVPPPASPASPAASPDKSRDVVPGLP
ncbi:MAG: YihY/virulence factor BrkB family protein [Actinomycetota bacterium]|nr:YihY/virulence factor BrkB family protein [Actinomycetota bacterium]